MKFLSKILDRFKPISIEDPTFGKLLYMNSYWECDDWIFPNTGTKICAFFIGDESGPNENYRNWYLELPEKFDLILELSKPKLQEVFRQWFDKDLPSDIFTELKLSGFDVENPESSPINWEISFETTGEKWLGIAIPFIDNEPQTPTVDT